MRKGGFILLLVLPLVLLMCMVAGYFFIYQRREVYNVQRQMASIKAFWLADAGVSRAIYELKNDYTNWLGITGVSLGAGGGEYSISIGAPVVIDPATTSRYVVSTGTIPSGLTIGDISRKIEVSIIKKQLPISSVSAPDVTINGSGVTVLGDIIYSDSFTTNPPGGDYSCIQDDSMDSWPQPDFALLESIARSQVQPGGEDNYFSNEELGPPASPTFPTSYWYDEVQRIPNVVYLEGDLTLNGNIGTIGGFFIVRGDVATDPEDTGDTSINGVGSIDGCIYTTGAFNINGGADSLNVNGGVWAGQEAVLRGTAEIQENEEYLQNIVETFGIYYISTNQWRELP
ncbi:MAG: hypothetical protein V1883_02745 [Candidatus Omnitrophota bacterium]